MANIGGGPDADVLVGTRNTDSIFGFEGDDTIDASTVLYESGPPRGDYVDGGPGNDTLIVNASAALSEVNLYAFGKGRYSAYAWLGNYYISVGAHNIENVRITGGNSADTFNTGIGGGSVNGGGGTDRWSADLRAVTTGIAFTLGTTTAIPAAGLTSILNIERISLATGRGDDTIVGGALADVVNGWHGADSLLGGAGADLVFGGSGPDHLDGGGDADKLWGGTDDDVILGGAGADVLTGQAGDDSIEGGAGDDTVLGGTGDDVLRTGEDADHAIGQAGADRIEGGAGNDTLNGGASTDTIVGGAGRDILLGGADADIFVFATLSDSGLVWARDAIRDFEQGLDRIDLSAIDAVSGGADDAFTVIGAAAFSGSGGELRWFQLPGATIIEGDVDGNGTADFQIGITGLFTLVGADFVL